MVIHQFIKEIIFAGAWIVENFLRLTVFREETPNMSVRCFGICKLCGRSVEDLKPCNNCGKLICSSCRCGTGSISDGYECILSCEFPRLKVKNKPKSDVLMATKGLSTVVAILVGCLLGSFLIWLMKS